MSRALCCLAISCVVAMASAAGVAAQGAACMPRTIYHVRSLADTTNEEHLSGRFTARAGVRFQCSCDTACRSDCQPSWRTRSCSDSGIVYHVPYQHKEYKKSKLKNGSKPWAVAINGGGADCGAGVGCFARKCFIGLCGSLPVTTVVQPLNTGVSISFNTNASVIHDLGLDLPFQCDRCVTSAELALDYPAITQVIQTPSDNMAAWLEICTFQCTGTNCSGGVCWESCTESCNLY